VLAIDLFTWWEISISWSIAFLIVAGLYLYASSRPKNKGDKPKESKQKMNDNNSIGGREDKIRFRAKAGHIIKDFIFVWILLGLLVFYIISVQLGTGAFSGTVFAGGNIVFEALIIFYLIRNRDKIRPKNKAA
jgi:hypothetical protein